ncbi:zinc ABC transporter substrate-binding protein ZnuA [Stappia sp. 28M-7]|uniref:zinc ABC transporter substrate-binding protein ZnuA n=1 Tax=Stappia sp. 28M-7 TaxID=2762596 RepID=UPI00163C85AB|nr:zinc ABC transporter substrate-binding protein ZnuA [Stappia sp. 28M-7]MBC2859212.1 zinc ABC transporter substrate-binding protein ZnuA [Stappia sp. 28M-7]
MTLARTLLLSASLLVATSAAGHAAPKVVASIKPVHSLVASVMQGIGEPQLIIEGAGSPHTYSLRPSQARALQDADLIFWIGHELEAFLEKPVETIGTGAKSVELIDAHGLVKLPFREGGAFEAHDHGDHGGEHGGEHGHADHDEDKHDDHAGHDHDEKHETAEAHGHDHGDADGHGHAHGAFDAHIWLDPENAKAMVNEIAEALSEADPENAAAYEANAAKTVERIETMRADIDARLTPLRGKGFIVFHDGYQYFEKRFDVTASGSITVSPEVMPGAERVAEIKARIGELGATCVFAEPQFEPKLIQVVTEGTAARSGVLDPLGAELADGPDLYFGLIDGLASSMEQCLGGNG